MAFGEHPNTKRVKGKEVSYCESCDREIKTTQRCEGSHKQRKEVCYFCHLLNEHVRTFGNSESKTVKTPA